MKLLESFHVETCICIVVVEVRKKLYLDWSYDCIYLRKQVSDLLVLHRPIGIFLLRETEDTERSNVHQYVYMCVYIYVYVHI
jgi:hypothetical protein